MFFPFDRTAPFDADVDLEAKDGRVAPKPKAGEGVFGPGHRKVFLIHGYNVPGSQAVTTLEGFRNCLTELAPSLRTNTFIVTWPGAWTAPVVAPIAFPYMIGNAVASAASLRKAVQDCFAQSDAPEEVVFVAHSLGCRLLIELLAELPTREERKRVFPKLQRLVVITMAAAVPADREDLLLRALGAVDAFVVLHSRADKVLRFAFPLGQLIESRFSQLAEAVGYAGNPRGLPWEVAEMRGYDHGDYWSGRNVVLEICRALAMHLFGVVVRWGEFRTGPLPVHNLPTTGPLADYRLRW